MGFLSNLFGGEQVYPTSVSTMDQFREVVVESDIPVIVDIWSPTCGPCKKLVPVLIKVATKHEGRILVAELNVANAEPKLLARLGVRATPTLLVFDGGQPVLRFQGYKPPSWFNEMIDAEFPQV